MNERIEVGDVVSCRGKNCVVSGVTKDDCWISIGPHVRELVLLSDCQLISKAAKDPYEGLTLPEPPPGYRLAKWGEVISEGSLWWDGNEYGLNGDWDYNWCHKWPWNNWALTPPWIAIFAVPVDSPITPQLQPDCKWVKKGWALHPTDFKMEDGKKVTAEYAGRSWDVLTEEEAAKHEWQRPRELDIEILHTQKRIKTAAHKLGEQEGQKYIWEMLQATAKAGAMLKEIRDRAEAAAKALQGGAE